MVAYADSGEARHLTDAPGTEVPIDWRTQGDRMTYIASGQGGTIRAYLLDLGSGKSSTILGNPLNNIAVWSRDGAQLGLTPFNGNASNGGSSRRRG